MEDGPLQSLAMVQGLNSRTMNSSAISVALSSLFGTDVFCTISDMKRGLGLVRVTPTMHKSLFCPVGTLRQFAHPQDH